MLENLYGLLFGMKQDVDYDYSYDYKYNYSPQYSEQDTYTYTYSPNDQIYYSPTIIVNSPSAGITKKEARLSSQTDVNPMPITTQEVLQRDTKTKKEARTNAVTTDTIQSIAIAVAVAGIGVVLFKALDKVPEIKPPKIGGNKK